MQLRPPDRWGQPDMTKLSINKNLATSRQAGRLFRLIITEALSQDLTGTILFFTAAVSGDNVTIWGALGHSVNLTIPKFQVTDKIDEVRWEKGKSWVAQFKKMESRVKSEAFEILTNGALQIKQLTLDDGGIYNVVVYNTDGRSSLEKSFDLRIQEKVSKPMIYWDCVNRTLICNVSKGTDLNLKLERGGKILIKLPEKAISHKWTKWTSLNLPFTCQAENMISKELVTETVSCSGKTPSFYFTVGACAGGLLLVALGALLIFCICKRKKQNRRRRDEELEIKAPRVSTVERGPKPHATPAAASQHPAVSQAPPPPGHNLQTPGHRPLPPSHRPREHQQRRRPPPSGTQIHQQKGPPLPRPRVQPKPPREGGEDATPTP
ncbi:T-cell surface antigen CD2 [Acomys russatus]|uniref:T-cell surface antigen CD2 n=1 Tax=Acomys russatus TaxID=60746 RepID=UPI0021E1D22A|nr:T-cell surface antigen CD2 [Acomys russatus]